MEVVAASDERSRRVADLALALAHSPDEIRRINDLVGDDIGDGPVRSNWSIPLATHSLDYGTLEVYSAPAEPADRDIAALFGHLASLVVAHAVDNHHLRVAIESRHTIGQAQGVLMTKYDMDGDVAFDVMKRYSQRHHLKLRLVAIHIVESGDLPPV